MDGAFRDIRLSIPALFYRELFKQSDSSDDDVFFDELSPDRFKKDPLAFLELIHSLDNKDMILHSQPYFKHEHLCRCNKPEDDCLVASVVNSMLMTYLAPEGICEGLIPTPQEDVRLKKTLPALCDKLKIPTVDTIFAEDLILGSENHESALETLHSWEEGFYIKLSKAGNGQGNYPMIPNGQCLSQLIDVAVELANINVNSDMVLTRRAVTPHRKYASHYGVLTFHDRNKTHVVSGILCYNLDSPETVHGGEEIGRIALTGNYVGERLKKEERAILKAHGLRDPKLPKKVQDIAKKVGDYAGKHGRLFTCSEVVQDVQGNHYLIDVNGVPGIGAIRRTEFPPCEKVSQARCCRLAANIIMDKLYS